MAISIEWGTKVITIPQADLTFVSGVLYELDVDAFRLDLKDLEDSEEGMPFPDTHRHNTEVVLSGVTYARFVEIINGYTVEFEDTASPYTVRCTGANHNLADVFVPGTSEVSLIIGNSAGLVAGLASEVESGYDVIQSLRVILASLAGKLSGAPSGPIYIRDVGDTKNRITATVDANGNRTSVTVDPD
jgi:hypothetical protein